MHPSHNIYELQPPVATVAANNWQLISRDQTLLLWALTAASY